jgi:hypothetical protein
MTFEIIKDYQEKLTSKSFPFKDLNVGDAFFVPDNIRTVKLGTARWNASRQLKRKFIIRTKTHNGIEGKMVIRTE